jgi:hypothetical protein
VGLLEARRKSLSHVIAGAVPTRVHGSKPYSCIRPAWHLLKYNNFS